MIYVLDTHALTWFIQKYPRLSVAARQVLENPANSFIVPTMVLVEIKFLHAKGRIKTDLPTVQQRFIAATNARVHPLDEEIVSLIPVGLDIHDSVIVATAIFYRDKLQQPTALIKQFFRLVASHPSF